MRTTLFLLAFCQLNYIIDIVARLVAGERRYGVPIGRIWREVITKCLESAPQLYFQAYVLLALGTHGEPTQAASVAISIASLAYGGMKIWAAIPAGGGLVPLDVCFRLATIPAKTLIVLTGMLDQAWRAAALALVLTEASRPVGVAVLLVFWALFVSLVTAHFCAVPPEERGTIDTCFAHVCLLCTSAALSTLVAHLAPGALLVMGNDVGTSTIQPMINVSRGLPRLAVLRWTEGLVSVAVAFAFAKTPCGHTPWREAWGLLGCLLGSALLYLALQLGGKSSRGSAVFLGKSDCFQAM